MRKTIICALLMLSLQAQAQNLFPIKLDNCKTDAFCLDCGEIKAGYDEGEFLKLTEKLNQELKLQGIRGAVKFQLLIQDNGKACVLSHTDQSKNPVTLKIIEELNGFKKWTPAIQDGKKQKKTSVNLTMIIQDGKISGKIERVDMDAFKKSFDHPNKPEIFNKTYSYKNENLKNYKITVWNSKNSNLRNNMNDHISVDQNNLIWLTVDEGLMTFDGKEFKNAEQNITDKGKFFGYYALATDNSNIKWVSATNNIYSFDNSKWTKHDPKEIGIDSAYEIINNPETGEVFSVRMKDSPF